MSKESLNRRTCKIVIPDGYESAKALAADCGFELVEHTPARTIDQMPPEGERTKAEEWEAMYAALFNQMQPIMAENKRLKEHTAAPDVGSVCHPRQSDNAEELQRGEISDVEEGIITQLIRNELWSEFGDSEAGLKMAISIRDAIRSYLRTSEPVSGEVETLRDCLKYAVTDLKGLLGLTRSHLESYHISSIEGTISDALEALGNKEMKDEAP